MGIHSEQVVVATGAWAAKLMRESGMDINVYFFLFPDGITKNVRNGGGI